MTLSNKILGKELDDLTYQDIETYFSTEKVETDNLEFKSINLAGNFDDKISGLTKSICGFLNSNGGLLIWGAPAGVRPVGGGAKRFQGVLTPYNAQIEKDSLINKITDKITPIPNRIRLNICEHAGNFVFVFEIESSEYSPHQTENYYYMRIDGQTRVAPHHYIEALFKKIKYPNIGCYLKITNATVLQNMHYRIDFDIYIFNWSPLQNDEDISFRIFGPLLFYPLSQDAPHQQNYRMSGKEYFRNPIQDIIHYGQAIRDANYFTVNPISLPHDLKMDLTIYFSGRFSPTKRCDYVLDFGQVMAANKNSMIVERKENITIADWQEEKGVNKESILNELLQ